jgi:hypothetical protein
VDKKKGRKNLKTGLRGFFFAFTSGNKKELIDIGFCLWFSMVLEIRFRTVFSGHWTI